MAHGGDRSQEQKFRTKYVDSHELSLLHAGMVRTWVASFRGAVSSSGPGRGGASPGPFVGRRQECYVSEMNHEPIIDNAVPRIPAAADLHVVDVIRRAEHELRQLMHERAAVTKRIGTVKRTIVGLAKLFGDGILDADPFDLAGRKGSSRQPGITGVCRRVLMEARRPMSARDICSEIHRSVPPLLARHKDPMATINTILGRLVEYGEATVLRGDYGQRVWLWAAEHESRAAGTTEPKDSGTVA
jgi:hypothetical protein